MLARMERVFSTFLSDWLRTEPLRPLVIRGARQVGKTWLVRDWAARERRALVEVNFERDPRLRRYFDQPDPRRIFDDLTLALEVAAAPEQAVLFLDEVQAAPEALAKLRWFAEEHPHLPVVAAGSLLEFGLADFAYSMPVGRIRYAYVEPLSFAEFLTAHGQTALRDRLARWRPEERLAAAVHDGAGRWYERYVMVGGMPAVVAQDTAGAPAAECRSLQRDLLQTYRDDFAKYAGRAEHGLLDSVLLAVVAALGGKFAYSRVGDGVKHHQAKKALDALLLARLCHLIPHSGANGVPLAAEASDRIRKVALLDVGLAHGLWNTPAGRGFPRWNELPPQIAGALAEQMTAQQLRGAAGSATLSGQLFHWRREGGRAGEIDYLLEVGARIVPLEVKSGAAGAMKSLHQFMYEKRLPLAVRLDRNPPSLQQVDVRTTRGDPVRYRLLNLPHYLAWRAPRLVEALDYGEPR